MRYYPPVYDEKGKYNGSIADSDGNVIRYFTLSKKG